MPNNQVSDPITDQEIAFAHLVLSGTMTDHRAAVAVGLNPDAAASTKAKPCVRAYMLEHRVAVHKRLVEQETEGPRPLNLVREQVLARLWEIGYLSPEITRGSITGQVKAISMIVAIEGLIPDRRAVSKSVVASEAEGPPPRTAQIYTAAWLREQKEKATVPQPSHGLVRDEDGPGVPDSRSGATADAPSDLGPPTFVPTETTPSSPYARVPDSAPDNRVPFSIRKNPFGRRR